MSEDFDERLGRLLREDAPSDRSALFRLSVLERRERQRFQRRSAVLAAAAAVFAIVAAIGFNVGIDLSAMAVIVVLCALLAISFFLSAPGVAMLVRRLRGTAGKS
jgi:choline-glycine betaine transporter